MYANYIVLLLMLWFIVEFVGVHCLININHLTFFYLLYTDVCAMFLGVMALLYEHHRGAQLSHT